MSRIFHGRFLAGMAISLNAQTADDLNAKGGVEVAGKKHKLQIIP